MLRIRDELGPLVYNLISVRQKTAAETRTALIIGSPTAAAVRRSMATTGGGPEDVAPLDEFEARVASTLDPEAVFGVSGGLDIGAPSPGMNANTTHACIYYSYIVRLHGGLGKAQMHVCRYCEKLT